MKAVHLKVIFLAVAYLASCQSSPNNSSQKENQVEKQEIQAEHPSVPLDEIKKSTPLSRQSESRTRSVAIKNTAPFNQRSFYQQFDKSPQTFTLSATQDTTIICSEGTRITIPANSLITESGSLPSR